MLQDPASSTTHRLPPSLRSVSGKKGVVMSYPYLDLQIWSHIHPKFVICNIGSQLRLQQNADRLAHFTDQQYVHKNPDSNDDRWSLRLERLYLCWKIFAVWRKVNEHASHVLAWKSRGDGASMSEIADSVTGVSHTTEGHYQTRSSGQISQVASPNPRMPAGGKGSKHRRNP